MDSKNIVSVAFQLTLFGSGPLATSFLSLAFSMTLRSPVLLLSLGETNIACQILLFVCVIRLDVHLRISLVANEIFAQEKCSEVGCCPLGSCN